MDKFKVIKLEEKQRNTIEQLGTKEKFWFDINGINHLFKMGRDNTGEDWVEVVVAEICMLLDIPHAKYSFAELNGVHGTLSEIFVPNGARLIHGNELLAKIYEKMNDEYDIYTFYKVRKYKLRLILILLNNEKFAPAFDIHKYDYLDNASDMFIGYMVLDCLVSNQDRHHENWGLILYNDNLFLAPTYDHASGLGSKESDKRKAERLKTNDKNFKVDAFVKKAKTPFYEADKLLKTSDVVEICAKMNRKTTLTWLEKIEKLDINIVRDILQNISSNLISDTSKHFAIEMIKENKERLLNIKKGLENV